MAKRKKEGKKEEKERMKGRRRRGTEMRKERFESFIISFRSKLANLRTTFISRFLVSNIIKA